MEKIVVIKIIIFLSTRRKSLFGVNHTNKVNKLCVTHHCTVNVEGLIVRQSIT